jgi:hypothetical protein
MSTSPVVQSTPTYMDPSLIFDQDIFTLLGVPDASEENKASLMQTITQSINNRIFARVLDMIPDEDAAELEQILENDGDVDAFLKSKGIDISTVAVQEALIYKTELAALAARPA